MQKFVALVIVAVWVVASTVMASAKTETVTGTLIDLSCRVLDKDNIANAHRNRGYNCAMACAMEGFAVGVLTADGKVYQVTGRLAANKNALLVPHMAQSVRISGDVGEKDGQLVLAADALELVDKSK
jgi:hypothetical protein